MDVFCSMLWMMMVGLLGPVFRIKAELTGCSQPLGLMSGSVKDWQISASSVLSSSKEPGCQIRYARLYQLSGHAWCAGHKSAFEWIQIDLGVAAKVTGIMTQGRGDGKQWVTSYFLSHSSDAFHWKYCTDSYGTRKVFVGNIDSHTIQQNYLDHPIKTRFLRLHILEWNEHPSMRVEILGCQECNQIISLPPQAKMSASSWRPWNKQKTCNPDDGHIYSQSGWCARKNDANQWLEVDLGPPTVVTGLVTKGRGDSKRKQWVASFLVSYSNDSNMWYFYKEDNYLNPKVKEFGGNMDKNTERHHYLNHPFVSRFVRIHPTSWHGRVSLRLGVIGCRHTGECGPGFFRIHECTECVENLAYQKETWVNDKRHAWVGWKYGHSSFAVDGEADNQLQKCAILDNYYVEYPIWMVDLGRKRTIRGVVIVTWQGKGQDRATPYRDYVYKLDKLTVYVEDRPRLESIITGSKCGSVSRMNGAVFRKKILIDCPANMNGRYVYVKATGVPNRWSRLYSAVLCEVLIY